MRKFIYFCIVLFSLTFFSCRKTIKPDITFVEIQNYSTHIFVSQTEITEELYSQIMGTEKTNEEFQKLPCTSVTLTDACEFCNKLNLKCGFKKTYIIHKNKNAEDTIKFSPDANGFRLLTLQEMNSIIQENSDDEGWTGTRLHKVASRVPEKNGLFDIKGNAKELCIANIQGNNPEYPLTEALNENSVLCSEDLEQGNWILQYAEKFNFSNSKHEITSFRICCDRTIDRSKINLIQKNEVEQFCKDWINRQIDSFFEENIMLDIPSQKISYPGKNVNGTDSINIITPSLKASEKTISKNFFEFVMNGILYDDIESPDFSKETVYEHYYESPQVIINNENTKTNVKYQKAILFCNKLSELKGLTPCYEITYFDKIKHNEYIKKNYDDWDFYKCSIDLTADGFRLPTYYEWCGFENQEQTDKKAQFNEEHWEWTCDNLTTSPYVTDIFEPKNFNEYERSKTVVRYAGENNKPIYITKAINEVTDYREPKSPNFSLRLFQTVDKNEFTKLEKENRESRSKVFNSLLKKGLKFTKMKGGIYNEGKIELADFEICETVVPYKIFNTVLCKLDDKISSNINDFTQIYFNDACIMCNELSSFAGYEKCYSQNDDGFFVCDFTKNGYRLPTKAEADICNFNDNQDYLCYDYFISDLPLQAETSFPYGPDPQKDLPNNHYEKSQYNSINYMSFIRLARTINIPNMKKLIAENKKQKKEIAEKIDAYFGFVNVPASEHSFTHKDSESNKTVSKKEKINAIKIMKTKMSHSDAEAALKYYGYSFCSYSYRDCIELNFLESVFLCNLLSIQANLTPCYTVNGKIISFYNQIKKYTDSFSIESETLEDFINNTCEISFNPNANGYRLLSETEWDYAASYGKAGVPVYPSNRNNSWSFSDQGSPNDLGLFLMNTDSSEWCFDEGNFSGYQLESYQRITTTPKYRLYKTRISRNSFGPYINNYRSQEEYSDYCTIRLARNNF